MRSYKNKTVKHYKKLYSAVGPTKPIIFFASPLFKVVRETGKILIY